MSMSTLSDVSSDVSDADSFNAANLVQGITKDLVVATLELQFLLESAVESERKGSTDINIMKHC